MTVLRIAFLLDALVTAWFIRELVTSLKSQDREGVVSAGNRDGQQVLLTIWIAFDLFLFAGIFWPLKCSAVLIIQLVYKLLWILLFFVPAWYRGQKERISYRLTGVFLLYCVVYPWVIPWRKLLNN